MPTMVATVSDERDALLKYLAQQRYFLRVALHELTREQATSKPSVSALNLAGLIKHTSLVEQFWTTHILAQRPLPEMDYDGGFELKPDESLDDVLRLQDEVASETEAIVNALASLDHEVPVPKGVPWFPDDVETWSARWILLHMIEEVARHAGHADIIRESIDGSNAFVLIAKHEGDNPEWLAMLESR